MHKDGTKIYNVYAGCKIIPKRSVKFIEMKMTILKTGTDFDFEYDSIKYKGERQNLLKFGVENKNGRTYHPENTEPLLEGLNKRGGDNCLLGELGHGKSNFTSLKNAGFNVNNVKIEGDILTGDVKPLDYPNKNSTLLIEMLKKDLIVFRPRGTGTINKDGTIENFTILSFDAISKDQDLYAGLI